MLITKHIKTTKCSFGDFTRPSKFEPLRKLFDHQSHIENEHIKTSPFRNNPIIFSTCRYGIFRTTLPIFNTLKSLLVINDFFIYIFSANMKHSYNESLCTKIMCFLRLPLIAVLWPHFGTGQRNCGSFPHWYFLCWDSPLGAL